MAHLDADQFPAFRQPYAGGISGAYRHILVPTDGSARAGRAARVAANLARRTGGRLTALHVMLERVPTLFSATLYASPALAPQYQAVLRQHADAALAAVEGEARRHGVPCDRVRARGRQPWRAILRTARRHGCDLIVMGSHGRDTGAAALLGSETTQVLARSKTPVLVCR